MRDSLHTPELHEIMDGIGELAYEIVARTRTGNDADADDVLWAQFFLARCVDAYGALRTLVEEDHVVDAMAITRALFEAGISCLYIYEAASEAQERRLRLLLWRRDGLEQFLRRERHLAQLGLHPDDEARSTGDWAVRTAQGGVDKIQSELAQMSAVPTRDATVVDKAKALGREDIYAIVFRESSSAIHTSPMLLGEYATVGGRGGQRLADYGCVLVLLASQMMCRLCAAIGPVVGVDSSERASDYSGQLTQLAEPAT